MSKFAAFAALLFSVAAFGLVGYQYHVSNQDDKTLIEIKTNRLEIIVRDQAFVLGTQATSIGELRKEREQILICANELKTRNVELRLAVQVAIDYIEALEQDLQRTQRVLADSKIKPLPDGSLF